MFVDDLSGDPVKGQIYKKPLLSLHDEILKACAGGRRDPPSLRNNVEHKLPTSSVGCGR